MEKIIVAIGGGEIKTKETLEIDRYIAELIKSRTGERRPCGLFLGTASHDSMPYFNSFRKTYTSVFDIKADVALTVYGEMDYLHIAEKFKKADFLYVGGGDTKFMIETWHKSGIINLIIDAYNRGVVLTGLSAGAICWFKDVYSDFDIISGESGEYKFMQGLNILDGLACPHYDNRAEFDEAFLKSDYPYAYAISNNSALVFVEGKFNKSIGKNKSYLLSKDDGELVKEGL
jgi:dipeptidase E